ncbi:hypothetical protein N0V88_003859 [Collariella sp. IMI 366227]|nr:hypothetical protein N0V88_003859 [Collariella sp. IMI 366227]
MPETNANQAVENLVITKTDDTLRLICRNDVASTPDKSVITKVRSGPTRMQVNHVIALDSFPDHDPVLANICEKAKTRYGYIQTDEEPVVCCFSKEADGPWKAAMIPVPWSKHGPLVLTTDLALWWLCMLAMSNQNDRAIISEANMIKIDSWSLVRYEHQGIWAPRHRYSSVEKPTDPPPPPSPPPYQVPLPGNQVTIEVTLGVPADVLYGFIDSQQLQFW